MRWRSAGVADGGAAFLFVARSCQSLASVAPRTGRLVEGRDRCVVRLEWGGSVVVVVMM